MEPQPIIYLETHSCDPAYNLAFEEYVLLNRRDGDYLILWQNGNTVVVGVNQLTEAEIDRGFVEARGIRVVRRSTGGGAVYHDLGNLNYSFITDHRPEDQLSMERFTQPVVEALRKLGVPAEATGRNDILAGGKKVSGTARKITGSRILHHGTLLFDSDPAAVAGALKAEPEKYRGRNTLSVCSRVGNIRPLLREDMDLPAFWEFIKNESSGGDFHTGVLSESELEEVRGLKARKYDAWEWNYGKAPKAEMHTRRRYPGGTVEAYVTTAGDRIIDIAFHGDFLSRTSLETLYDALRDIRFTAEAVAEVLQRCNLTDFFGAITLSEIIDLLFYS